MAIIYHPDKNKENKSLQGVSDEQIKEEIKKDLEKENKLGNEEENEENNEEKKIEKNNENKISEEEEQKNREINKKWLKLNMIQQLYLMIQYQKIKNIQKKIFFQHLDLYF